MPCVLCIVFRIVILRDEIARTRRNESFNVLYRQTEIATVLRFVENGGDSCDGNL